MTQSKTLIFVVLALVIGFAGGFVLRPVIMPPGMAIAGNAASVIAGPRGTQYFAANLSEARQIVAGCETGSVRGDECANAEQAVLAAEGRERLKRFMGKRP